MRGHKHKLADWPRILAANWTEGTYKGIPFAYTRPSPDWNRAPFWLWDSCFHAYMWARLDPDRAKREIRTMLRFKYSSGLPPMMLFLAREGFLKRLKDWLFFTRYLLAEPPGTILTQPPVMAEAVWEIYQRDGDLEFLISTAPELKKVYDYFARERDIDQDHLISIVHPLESGTDSLPEFDEAIYGRTGIIPFYRFYKNLRLYREFKKMKWDMRRVFERFNMEMPMFNALYALNLKALNRILNEINDPDASLYEERAAATTRALVDKAYDAERGLFVSLYQNEHLKTKVKTISSIMPIVLDLPKEVVASLVRHIENPLEYATPFPVPSVARDEPAFYPGKQHYLWRGTSWIVTNWYIVRGLLKHGYVELAKKITLSTIQMVQEGGLWEYYNSLTGKGDGDTEHGWTALVVDMAEMCGIEIS